jgi:hypothetical protein
MATSAINLGCQCNETPARPETCLVDTGGYSQKSNNLVDDTSLNNAQRRFQMYRWAAGELGFHGDRYKLPQCVADDVRGRFPDPKGNYVGFKPKK